MWWSWIHPGLNTPKEQSTSKLLKSKKRLKIGRCSRLLISEWIKFLVNKVLYLCGLVVNILMMPGLYLGLGDSKDVKI